MPSFSCGKIILFFGRLVTQSVVRCNNLLIVFLSIIAKIDTSLASREYQLLILQKCFKHTSFRQHLN